MTTWKSADLEIPALKYRDCVLAGMFLAGLWTRALLSSSWMAFLDAGFNFADTADSYSTWVAGHRGGESETVIGNWFKARGNRDKVILATKVGSEVAGRKGL